jgi:hypothetical protein
MGRYLKEKFVAPFQQTENSSREISVDARLVTSRAVLNCVIFTIMPANICGWPATG